MSWYSTNSESFPAAVSHALLPENTVIHENYTIKKAVRVCGTELCYLAVDSRTQKNIMLHEILPMRWCMRDENGNWTPYQSDSENMFDPVKTGCLTRLTQLQNLHGESALENILEVFEERGTVWFTTDYAEQESLFHVINGKLFTPQEAIDLLTPIMDTLVGLHAESMPHGMVSAQTIVQQDEEMFLTSWCIGLCVDGSDEIQPSDDVQALSSLLYQMMTGEQTYSKETAAVLPSGIRNALRKGMETSDMSMEQLWSELHRDQASKRSKKAPQPGGNSGLFTKRFTAVFCALCLILPLAVGGLMFWGKHLKDAVYNLSDEQIRVPELLYMSQEDAVSAANALGLHIIIAAREDNPVIEENHVVTQKPTAGAILRTGDTVQLTVSDGWTNYVPDVCHLLLEDAQQKLEELGFVVEYEEVLSAGDAPGTVISQDIEPDELMSRDSVIKLLVSLGRKDLDSSKYETVGNYVGMNFDEAKALLSELHLYALQAEAVYDREVPEGCIIEQNIPERRRVPQGTVIEMKVSLGVETVRVPHVQMMSAANAKGMLERLRLKPVMIYAASDTYAMDSVMSQNVAPGKLVPVGSEIWLTISTGKGNTVISTGGWSGDPLPTVEVTEDTSETSVSTDTSETDLSETQSTTTTVETDATEKTTEATELTTTVQTESKATSTTKKQTAVTTVTTTKMTSTEPLVTESTKPDPSETPQTKEITAN